MLALRVCTLTDEEKEEIRRGEPRARAILERTGNLPTEQLAIAHDAVQKMPPSMDYDLAAAVEAAADLIEQPFDPFSEHTPIESAQVFGMELRTGDRVRLWPHMKLDIPNAAMEGKVGIVEAIEQDFEDNLQFAVVLADDHARDMDGISPDGHRFFFSPQEVEPLGIEAR